MLRNILLTLVALVIGMGSATANQVPLEVRQNQCHFLAGHFSYIYELRLIPVEEPLVEEIVARDPNLDPIMQWPLALAVKLIYDFKDDHFPDPQTWMLATQMACVRVIGLDFLEPRGNFRMIHRNPRMEIMFK